MNCARVAASAPAKILDGRKLYAVEMLDEFFDALPDEAHDSAEDWTVSL
jgi:hypothetical protein